MCLLKLASSDRYHLWKSVTHTFSVYLSPPSCFKLDVGFSVHCCSSENVLPSKPLHAFKRNDTDLGMCYIESRSIDVLCRHQDI